MAKFLKDRSILMADGRVLWGRDLVKIIDVPELAALLAPQSPPFMIGGGGGRGPQGLPGPVGPAGPSTIFIGQGISGSMDGSILFVGVGNVLSQNEPALSWDDTKQALTVTKLQTKVSPWSDVKAYGAIGDGVTDDTAAINAAIAALDPTYGGIVYFPAGKYIFSSAIAIPKNTKLMGAGKKSTILSSSHTGDGLTSTWPINSSTGVFISVEDMTIENTNGSNTGGGFVDVGGTFVTLKNVRVNGFQYGIIFDQTELGDITFCDIENPITGGLWLANGPDHTVGAAVGFTNRISVRCSQFNSSLPGIAIIDDGGYVHDFIDNNFNGWVNHLRLAGVVGCSIFGGEFESATSTNIIFTNLSLLLSTGVGQCLTVVLGGGAVIVPSVGQSCILIVSLSDIVYSGVYFGNSAAAKVIGNVNCATCVALRFNNAGGGVTFDFFATHQYEVNDNTDGAGTAIFRTNYQTVLYKQLSLSRTVPTYGVSVAIDASIGNEFDITATDGVAFTVANPSNATDGQRITITVRNTSGGALGVVTFDTLYKLAAWTSPATGFSRSIDFKYNGTNWIEVGRTTADVPN